LTQRKPNAEIWAHNPRIVQQETAMKVLLAVDGSKHTKSMLAYLTTHEGLLGAKPDYVVLNVQLPIPSRAARAVGKEIVAQFHHTESEAVLNPVCKFLDRHEASYKTRVATGHPADEILNAAKKEKVDLIVMGSRGHGSITSMILGSVAQKVLSHADVPVMVVR
jgi:nucleotide-binding universal stress UspA family protein